MNRSETKCFSPRQVICLMAALSVVLSLVSAKAGLAAEGESTQHFKMLSTIEYSGKGQFRSHAETLFAARKEALGDDKVRYFLATDDFDLVESYPDSAQPFSSGELSFVIDRKSRHLSVYDKDLALFGRVNNECVSSLKKVTSENIGKTWEQTFDMSFLGDLLGGELKFTMTAIQLETKVFGEMVAVRALSEPFVVNAAKQEAGTGDVKCNIGAVYLFDPEFEEIYLSASVFEAATNINGFKEKLRHEVATYKTDAMGVSADLAGLSRKFEKFVRKLGLRSKSLKVVEETALPQWARSEGLRAALVANICAATACEGALNPVALVCMPAVRTMAFQSFGRLVPASKIGIVSASLAKSVPGIGAMKIAVAPAAFMGISGGTAAVIGGGTATAVGLGAGGGGGGGGDRSSPVP